MKCKGRSTVGKSLITCWDPSKLDDSNNDIATNERAELARVLVNTKGHVLVEAMRSSTEQSRRIPGLADSPRGSVACNDDMKSSTVQMEVMGIYKRGKEPREAELAEARTINDYAPDQIMVRKRLRTKPLMCDKARMAHSRSGNDSDGNEADDESDDNNIAQGNTPGPGYVDQFGPPLPPPQPAKNEENDAKKTKSKRSKSGRTKRSLRRRLKTKASDGTEYDVTMFKREEGLVMRKSDWPFYHADLSEHSDDSTDDERVYDERAILWQSIENYEALMSNPVTSDYFLPQAVVEAKSVANNTSIEVDADGGVVSDPATEAIELIMDNPRFGEQVIVKGISAKDIAIGDIFEVEGGHSPLKVQVSSPRLPCSYVDKRNGSPFGMKGVKRYTMTKGLAGWFTRVLVPGELRDGMLLVRTAHPHPKWTLPEISRALYGEGPKRRQMLGCPYWNRSKEELQELCNLNELGQVDWKDEAQWILGGNDSDYEEDQRKKGGQIQNFSSMGYLGALAAAGLAACCCGGMAIVLFRE